MTAGVGDFVGVDWRTLPGRHPTDMDELVDGWITIALAAERLDRTEPPESWVREPTDHLIDRHPDHVLALVFALLARPIPDRLNFRIAAVPLWGLLARHGLAVIGKVEQFAGEDERFRQVLRSLDRSGITDGVWRQVLTARGDVPVVGPFAGVDWGTFPPVQLPQDMDELIDGWVANAVASPKDDTHFWAWEAARYLTERHPDRALEFIVGALARPISDDTRYGLAAGPLEDLLAYNGAAVIEDIERLARQNAVFRDTLRGVWKNAMTDAIWDRVVVARGTLASP